VPSIAGKRPGTAQAVPYIAGQRPGTAQAAPYIAGERCVSGERAVDERVRRGGTNARPDDRQEVVSKLRA